MNKRLLSLCLLSSIFATGLFAQTCQIGDVKFNSVRDALNAAPAYGAQTAITMIADEYIQEAEWLTNEDSVLWISEQRDIVLDLNSKTLEKGFRIDGGSSLTIRDTGGQGQVTGSYLGGTIRNYGFTRIEGGTFTSQGSTKFWDYSLIYNYGRRMEISGGTFLYDNMGECLILNSAPMLISGGTFTSDSQYETIANFSELTITDGKFTRLSNYYNNPLLWTDENSSTTIEGGFFTSNSSGSTIWTNGNADIRNATVESTGQTYGYTIHVASGASVTIDNSTFTSQSQENTNLFVASNGYLHILGGTFRNDGKWNVLYVDASGLALISGGTFINSNKNTNNNANTLVNFGGLSVNEDNGPVVVSNLGGYAGCIYSYPSSATAIDGGRFMAKSRLPLNGTLTSYRVWSGLFSNATNMMGRTDGLIVANEDEATREEYPDLVERLPVSHIGRVWLRNVKSGHFVGAGDGAMYDTQSLTSVDGLCLDMLDVAGGKYVAFMPKANYSWGYKYLDDNKYLPFNHSFLGIDPNNATYADRVWVDRPLGSCAYVKEEVRPGQFSLYLMGRGYLVDKDGEVRLSAKDLDDAMLWEIVTYDDIKAGMATATLDNPVDATQLVGNTDFMPNYYRNSLTEEYAEYPFGRYVQPWGGTFAQENLIANYSNTNNQSWNYLGVSARKFDVSQTITDLPEGYYLVSCQGFYRNGSTPAAVALKRKNGTEALNAKFYANQEETPIMSLIDGATQSSITTGSTKTTLGYVPNTVAAMAAYFGTGRYTNNLVVKVTDGTLTIGFKNEEKPVSGEWTVVDKVRLTYFGNDISSVDDVITSVRGIDSEQFGQAQPTDTYNLNGMPTGGMTRGINIVRMSDGTVRKVLVK